MITWQNKQYNLESWKIWKNLFQKPLKFLALIVCTWNGQSYTACLLKRGLLYNSYILKFILGVNIDAQNMQCTQKTIQYMLFVSIGNLRWPKWFNVSSLFCYILYLKCDVPFLFFDLCLCVMLNSFSCSFISIPY